MTFEKKIGNSKGSEYWKSWKRAIAALTRARLEALAAEELWVALSFGDPDIAILAEEAMVSLETTITELKEALRSEQDGPPPAPAAASKKNKANP